MKALFKCAPFVLQKCCWVLFFFSFWRKKNSPFLSVQFGGNTMSKVFVKSHFFSYFRDLFACSRSSLFVLCAKRIRARNSDLVACVGASLLMLFYSLGLLITEFSLPFLMLSKPGWRDFPFVVAAVILTRLFYHSYLWFVMLHHHFVCELLSARSEFLAA